MTENPGDLTNHASQDSRRLSFGEEMIVLAVLSRLRGLGQELSHMREKCRIVQLRRGEMGHSQTASRLDTSAREAMDIFGAASKRYLDFAQGLARSFLGHRELDPIAPPPDEQKELLVPLRQFLLATAAGLDPISGEPGEMYKGLSMPGFLIIFGRTPAWMWESNPAELYTTILQETDRVQESIDSLRRDIRAFLAS